MKPSERIVFTVSRGASGVSPSGSSPLLQEDKTKKTGIGKEKGEGSYYNHMEELAGKTEVMNLYEYSYEKKTNKDVYTSFFCFKNPRSNTSPHRIELNKTIHMGVLAL